MRNFLTIFTIVLLGLPVFAQAQIEKKDDKKAKKEVALIDSLPQVLEFHLDIFRDSTWGKDGLNMRMAQNSAKNGSIPKKFQSIDKVEVGDLICEYFNADASIVVREVMKNPLQSSQQQATFSLFVQRELKAVKLEVRRVRQDRKTEKIGSFRLKKLTDS